MFHGGQKYDADAKVEGGGAGVRGNFLACLTSEGDGKYGKYGGNKVVTWVCPMSLLGFYF